MRNIALLLASSVGLTLLSMGAAHAGVDPSGDPGDRHAWVTAQGELKQIKKGMRESKVNRILDGKGSRFGIDPRRYGGKRKGVEHASAVIPYDTTDGSSTRTG